MDASDTTHSPSRLFFFAHTPFIRPTALRKRAQMADFKVGDKIIGNFNGEARSVSTPDLPPPAAKVCHRSPPPTLISPVSHLRARMFLLPYAHLSAAHCSAAGRSCYRETGSRAPSPLRTRTGPTTSSPSRNICSHPDPPGFLPGPRVGGRDLLCARLRPRLPRMGPVLAGPGAATGSQPECAPPLPPRARSCCLQHANFHPSLLTGAIVVTLHFSCAVVLC